MMEHPIYKKIEASKTVDFGNVLSKSYELFLKIWREGAMHSLIIFIAIIPFILVAYLPLIYMSFRANNYNSSYYYDDYYSNDFPISDGSLVGFFVVYFILLLVFLLIVQIVQYGVGAHFYKVCRIVDMETGEEHGNYFEFLKGKNFMRLFLLTLATMGIAIGALLLCILPIFYVMVPLQLFLPIFAFNKKISVSDIIKAAFKLGHKHWIYVFGFAIIASNVAQLGAFICLVGIIFTMCIVYLPIYFFYKETIGFDIESNQNDNLIQQY